MLRDFLKLELKWWQAGIYEIAMISLGILIGARFYFIFERWVVFFLIVFLAGGGYIFWLWYKEAKGARAKREKDMFRTN